MVNGDLTDRGILREENGYYIIRQYMPYPLGDNNAYLVEDNSGWTVIDVGIELPRTRQVWEMVFDEVGINCRDVNAIYVTHCHPDHLGAARWLQEKCSAPVFMSQTEIERSQEFVFFDDDFEKNYTRAIKNQFASNDFPLDICQALVRDWHLEVAPRYPQPAEILPVLPGDKLELQGEIFTLLAAPVHADGQLMLWSPKLGHLFSADVMVAGAYLHFTDWPNSYLDNPLANFFTLAEDMQKLGNLKAFPGHGTTFFDMSSRLERLTKRHQRYLSIVENAVKAPMTAGQIYLNLVEEFGFKFEEIDYIHLHRVLMGEILGYLQYLVSQKRLQMYLDTSKYYYAPIR